jgi:Domain of unknown function (DUF4337)
MAETPEIPEAKDPYEKAIAISIAVMAVILSVISNHSDDAKTEAIIKTNEAANKWGYFQAKSIKQHVHEDTLASLAVLNASALDQAKLNQLTEKMRAENKRYEDERKEIKSEAEALEKEATQKLRVNNRGDLGSLLLQIAIVMASIAILGRWKPFWLIGVLLGLVGAGIGLSGFFV